MAAAEHETSAPASRRRHDEVLADIARVAGSSLELPEVLEGIVSRAAALTGADRSSIWLLDRTRQRLQPSALYGMDRAFTEEWKGRPLQVADEPLSRDVIASGEPAIVVDAAADPRTDKSMVQFFGDQSILVVPLVRRGTVIGTLYMNHVRRRYAFTEDDVHSALAIASQAAIAIDNARLYGRARRLADQLRLSFQHAGEALAAGADVGLNLQLMVQMAVETLGADGGALELLEADRRGTYGVANAGAAPADGAHRTRVPLTGESGPLGALELWRVAPPFSEDEEALLAAFAVNARSAIEHSRLYASLREEQERRRAAERREAEFTSMISHELRTPLALIKGYVAALLRPPVALPPERARRFAEGIDEAATRLQRLIDNLLSANRLDAEMFTVRPEPLEVRALVQRAVLAASVLATDRVIEVDVPAGELWVLGDADQLSQVLENLVGNAIKYAPPETPVRVSARAQEGTIRISVEDSGPGIPEAALERIFEKFYRVTDAAEGKDSPVARNVKGLGLGLYICRRIVEAHGGRIWAENGPRGGSTFHVQLAAGAARNGN